ncbi:MAG: hypothetical protein WA798_07910, partial [Candidatus Acidiferrum sp.]
RTTSLGALALAWGLLVGESATAKAVASELKWHLLIVGGLAILVMFLDFLQYVAGYWTTYGLYEQMRKSGQAEGLYNESAWSFRFRKFFFYAKMVTLAITVIWLLTALGRWLIQTYA